jgi:ribosomal protein L20A (L18A)
MPNLRKFEILGVIADPSGPGPDRYFKIKYKAIKNKEWVEKQLGVMARNETEARDKAMKRFGGKN